MSAVGIEFSQFNVGGAPINGDIIVGLRGGLNTQFTFQGNNTTATALINTITQTAHGFIVGNVVYFTGGQYQLAKADTAADAEVVGIVSSVIDANDFNLLTSGYVTTLSGLAAGSVYFLSDTTAGALSTTEPSTGGHISKPLLIATSSTSGFFFNWRGKIVPTANFNTLTFVTNTDETAILPNSQPLSTLASGLAYVTTATGIVSTITAANSATLVSSNTGTPSWTASMTNGQVLIGSTGATPAPATLTAGAGINITNGAHSITITNTAFGNTWVDQTITPVTLAANTGYVADNAGLVTFNMPATVPFGTEYEIRGQGAGGWLVQFNAGQTGHLSSAATSLAGSFASTNRYDCISILCTVANTTFVCTATGSITNA